MTCARPSGPRGVLAALRKKGGSGLAAGRQRVARSFALAGSERGLRTRGNAGWSPPLRARVSTLENVPVRRCLKVCCRSRRAVPGLRSHLALSAGWCTRPSAHHVDSLREKRRETDRKIRGRKRVGGTKVRAKGHGVVEREDEYFGVHRGGKPQRELARAWDDGRDHDGWFVGGCSCWHLRTRHTGESLSDGKRHPAMEGVLVRLQPVGFHDRTVTTGSACTRSIDAPARKRRLGSTREGDRDVRGRSSSNTTG